MYKIQSIPIQILFMLLAVVLVACMGPPADATPEERAAYEAKQVMRAELYLEFAEREADKFVASGKWDRAHVDEVTGLLRTGIGLVRAYQSAGAASTPEEKVAAELALERGILAALSLGIDRLSG